MERIGAELSECDGASVTVGQFGRLVSAAVKRFVPHDGYSLIWFDPVSGGRAMHVSEDALPDCGRVIENDASGADMHQFAELGRRRVPVGLLGNGGDADRRSRRLHELLRPAGFGGEARVVLRSGVHAWGALVLLRSSHTSTFAERDEALLHRIGTLLAEPMRRYSIRSLESAPPPLPAGVVVLDADNRVEAVSPEAQAWLADLHRNGEPTAARPLPVSVYASAAAARGGPAARAGRVARIRTASGRWLVLQSTLLDGDGRGRVAVMFQPAGPEQMMPALWAWYRLSPREIEVTENVLAGRSTKQIARLLGLSLHTVEDHLKVIYRKTGVQGRDQLSAKILR